MAVWGGLTNSCEKKRSKSKGEKERYKHLNAEFQRIARKDKKAFLRDQCKEIVKNNRMGKTRGLFKKIRDTKGTFHAKMSTVKDRNGTDLTEADDIKKRWQEYTEELWTEVHDTVQEAGIKTFSKIKKCRKAKWLSEDLQIAKKRREAKGKGEKERYNHFNAELQRTIRKPSSVTSAKK